MLSIRSSSDLARALSIPLDPQLRRLVVLRHGQLLGDHAHFIVVEPGDPVAVVEHELGFLLTAGESDPDYAAPFEWVARHGDWFEAVLILSDDGYATVLLVPDHAGIDHQLRRIINEYA